MKPQKDPIAITTPPMIQSISNAIALFVKLSTYYDPNHHKYWYQQLFTINTSDHATHMWPHFPKSIHID